MPGTSDPGRSDVSYKVAVDEFIREKQEVMSGVDQLSLDDSVCSPEHTRSLYRLFTSIKTLTAKEDMLHTLKYGLNYLYGPCVFHNIYLNRYYKTSLVADLAQYVPSCYRSGVFVSFIFHIYTVGGIFLCGTLLFYFFIFLFCLLTTELNL